MQPCRLNNSHSGNNNNSNKELTFYIAFTSQFSKIFLIHTDLSRPSLGRVNAKPLMKEIRYCIMLMLLPFMLRFMILLPR